MGNEAEDEDDAPATFGYRAGQYVNDYDYVTDFFSSMTTFHGMVRLYNAESWYSRALWFLALLLCFILFIVEAIPLLANLKSRPTNTQVTFVVPDGQLFPVMTICSLSRYPHHNIRKLYNSSVMSDPVIEAISSTSLTFESSAMLVPADRALNYSAVFNDFKSHYFKITGQQFDVLQFHDDIALTCEDSVVYCKFGGEIIQDCCNSSIPIRTDYGMCFQFVNILQKYGGTRQYITGEQFGFDIMLNAHVYSQRNFTYTDHTDVGFKFYVHSATDYPMMGMHGYGVSPGHKTFGAITLTNISLLSESNWGYCTDSWRSQSGSPEQLVFYLAQLANGASYNYTAANCMTNCVLNIMLTACPQENCRPQRYLVDPAFLTPNGQPTNNNTEVCGPLQLYRCATNFTANAADTVRWWLRACACTVECTRPDYSLELSDDRIPNTAALRVLTMNASNFPMPTMTNMSQRVRFVKDNYVEISVAFKDNFYERHEQRSSTSITNVMSSIGGSMGLFLGMSVITLAEVGAFILQTMQYMVAFFLIDCWPAISRKLPTIKWKKRQRHETDAHLQPAPYPGCSDPTTAFTWNTPQDLYEYSSVNHNTHPHRTRTQSLVSHYHIRQDSLAGY